MTPIPRVLFYLLLVALLSLSACMGKVYRNESHSMEPTLWEGDYLRVHATDLAELARGDLVLYANPLREEESYVKRLIGLPGETVEIRDGAIYINGVLLVEEYAVHPIPAGTLYGPQTMGDDEYFMLGDNRPQSQDSRFHGPIPGTLIQGRAFPIQ